ncbi:hypothetical protein QJS66_22790 [Kocuria rhizophila]|nr:hypothetical protein QJS66_22790 [Kocuria rhizophila]
MDLPGTPGTVVLARSRRPGYYAGRRTPPSTDGRRPVPPSCQAHHDHGALPLAGIGIAVATDWSFLAFSAPAVTTVVGWWANAEPQTTANWSAALDRDLRRRARAPSAAEVLHRCWRSPRTVASQPRATLPPAPSRRALHSRPGLRQNPWWPAPPGRDAR